MDELHHKSWIVSITLKTWCGSECDAWNHLLRYFMTCEMHLKCKSLCDASYLVKVINLAIETAGTDYWREQFSFLHSRRVQKAKNLNIKNSPRGWNHLCTIVWLWMTQICRESLQTHFHAKNTEWLMDFLLSRVHCTVMAQKTKKCLTRSWYTAAPLLLMIGCAELLFAIHDEDRRHIHSFWTDNHRVLDSNKQNFISKKRSISYDFLPWKRANVHSTCSHQP